jgi:hypothetical protein
MALDGWHDDDRHLLEATSGLLETVADRPMGDRLLLLQMAWIALAQRARNDALAFPGGFQRELARQLAQLEKVVALVQADVPDLELERMTQEGDFDGVLRHLQTLMDKRAGPPPTTKDGA